MFSPTIYEFGPVDMGNKVLRSYGDTLGELLDNATYVYGEDMDEECYASDDEAHEVIKEWYRLNKCPEIEPRYETDPMTLAKNYDEENY